MESLESLRERINEAISDKIIGEILKAEARHHFKHGYRSDCCCSVCVYRRNYARAQNSKSYGDSRYLRAEANRSLKRKVLVT